MLTFNFEELSDALDINHCSAPHVCHVLNQLSFTPAQIKIDSRKVIPGDIFIAIQGEKFDAHDYVLEVLNKGANLVIVDNRFYTTAFNLNHSESLKPFKDKIISVGHSKDALGQLAGLIRRKSSAKFVALTGSSGKTSVKEMTAAILANMGKVLATQGNFNNEIGVPLTLLNLTGDEDYAVIELGANHQGEIAYTASITQPHSVLINTICQAHLEGFGSLHGVTLAKSEIFSYPKTRKLKYLSMGMPALEEYSENQQVILNADILIEAETMKLSGLEDIKSEGEILSQHWQSCLAKIHDKILFSAEHPSYPNSYFSINHQFKVESLKITETGSHFNLMTPQGCCEIYLKVLGKHAVSNALAAAILSMSVGASLEAVKKGLDSVTPVKGRLFPLNISQTDNEAIWVIDDSYNANVGSMKAAAALLNDLPGYKVFVVGDMAEMGTYSQACHEEVGRFVADSNIDAVYSVGMWSQYISNQHPNSAHFDSKSTLIKQLKTILKEHAKMTFIVKGSRSSAMEEIVFALQER